MRLFIASRKRGFTLAETVIAMVILLFAGLGAVASVIYTRQSMELDKQKLAALNYCRQAFEAASTLATADASKQTLVPFNAPGLEIEAIVTTEYYPLNTNGTIAWSTPLSTPPQGRPVLCRVAVRWLPAGSWSRPQQISMQSIVRKGTT